MKSSRIVHWYDNLDLYLFVESEIPLTLLENKFATLIGIVKKILILVKILDIYLVVYCK